MYAHAVDQAGERLRELRLTEWQDFALGALTLALALTATQLAPSLAFPLFIGGMSVGALGLRAMWRHWDLVDRLAGERNAYVIPEVLSHAAREAGWSRRRSMAAYLRADAREYTGDLEWTRDELIALACELENEELDLDPVSAVACSRLLSDPAKSPLLNSDFPAEELWNRIRHIRAGFEPQENA
jgi:hypothetical protein